MLDAWVLLPMILRGALVLLPVVFVIVSVADKSEPSLAGRVTLGVILAVLVDVVVLGSWFAYKGMQCTLGGTP